MGEGNPNDGKALPESVRNYIATPSAAGALACNAGRCLFWRKVSRFSALPYKAPARPDQESFPLQPFQAPAR